MHEPEHENTEMENWYDINKDVRESKEELERRKKNLEFQLSATIVDPEHKESLKIELAETKKNLQTIGAYKTLVENMSNVSTNSRTKERENAIKKYSEYIERDSQQLRAMLEARGNVDMYNYERQVKEVIEKRKELIESLQKDKEGKKNRILTKKNFAVTATIAVLALFFSGFAGGILSRLVNVTKDDSDALNSYNKLMLYIDSLKEAIKNKQIDIDEIWEEFGRKIAAAEKTTTPITIEEQVNALNLLHSLIFDPNDSTHASDMLALAPEEMQSKIDELHQEYHRSTPPLLSYLYYHAAELTYNVNGQPRPIPDLLIITLLMLALQRINYELHHNPNPVNRLLSTSSDTQWSKKESKESKKEDKKRQAGNSCIKQFR